MPKEGFEEGQLFKKKNLFCCYFSARVGVRVLALAGIEQAKAKEDETKNAPIRRRGNKKRRKRKWNPRDG